MASSRESRPRRPSPPHLVEVALSLVPRDLASSGSASRHRVAPRSPSHRVDGCSRSRGCVHRGLPRRFDRLVSSTPSAPRQRRVCVSRSPEGPRSPRTRAVLPRPALHQRTPRLGADEPEGASTCHTRRCRGADPVCLCCPSPTVSRRSRCPEGCRSRRLVSRLRETRCGGAQPLPTSTPEGGSVGCGVPSHRNSRRRVGVASCSEEPSRLQSASCCHESPAAGLAVSTVHPPEGEHTTSQREPTAARRCRVRLVSPPKSASSPATHHVAVICPASESASTNPRSARKQETLRHSKTDHSSSPS